MLGSARPGPGLSALVGPASHTTVYNVVGPAPAGLPGGISMTDTYRAVTRLERADFYADWLEKSQRNELDLGRTPVVARGRDLHWVETVNDYRIAMLIGEQVGFPTQGKSLSKAVIPAGHHTGRHRHGEEAIHVLEGSGAIVVEGRARP